MEIEYEQTMFSGVSMQSRSVQLAKPARSRVFIVAGMVSVETFIVKQWQEVQCAWASCENCS